MMTAAFQLLALRYVMSTINDKLRVRLWTQEYTLLQRSAEVSATGLVNFDAAVAYHFCLNLPAAFTKHGAST